MSSSPHTTRGLLTESRMQTNGAGHHFSSLLIHFLLLLLLWFWLLNFLTLPKSKRNSGKRDKETSYSHKDVSHSWPGGFNADFLIPCYSCSLEVSLITLCYLKFPWPTQMYYIMFTFYSPFSFQKLVFYIWLLLCWVQFTQPLYCAWRGHTPVFLAQVLYLDNGTKTFVCSKKMMRMQTNPI